MIIHPDLTIIEEREDGYAAQRGALRFIVSDSVEDDGRRWRHASVSRIGGRLPEYGDLMELKRLCIGDDKTALQVFPPKGKHIDIAGPLGVQVLHLWCCLDGDVTPDFTRGGDSI